tara:strand:- start:188 stop:343 length:156 start_codon:yes stop_codon:yes gene_type:complete
MSKIYIFKILARINKLLLPSLSKRGVDVHNLKPWQKALIGYRYWVTKNSYK